MIGDDAPARERMLSALAAPETPARQVLEETLEAMQRDRTSRGVSFAVGLATLLFAASGALVELDATLNRIWGVPPRASRGVAGAVKVLVKERLAGFALVGGIGATLLASLVTSSLLAALAARAESRWAPALLRTAELATSLGLTSLVFALAFHLVPRCRPPLREVAGGAVLTAALLAAVKEVFAGYLSDVTSYSAYGVVGSVLALATWIYVSSQVIFLGATLTRSAQQLTGSPRPTPAADDPRAAASHEPRATRSAAPPPT